MRAIVLEEVIMRNCSHLSVLALIAATAEAQLPPGFLVYAHRSVPTQSIVHCGITAIDPVAGTYVPITGLPPALLHGGLAQSAGAGCVLVRDRDGELFAAAMSTLPGEESCIYQLTLGPNLAVKQVRAFPIGVALGDSRILQMDFLIDGRIVYVHNGPGAQEGAVRILDPQTGSDAPALWMRDPLQPPSAVAASRTELKYLVGTFNLTGSIHEVDLQGRAVTQIATLPRGVVKLAVNHRTDHIHAALDQYGVCDIDRSRVPPYIRPLTTVANVQGLCVERAGGRLYVANPTVFGGNYQWLDPVTRAWQPLPGAYPAESPTDISCRSTLLPYGSDASPTQRSSWMIEGNLGGAPSIGNLGFSISMLGTAVGVPGLLLVSGRSSHPLHMPFPEVHNILVDPSNSFFYAVLPALTRVAPAPSPSTTSMTVPLPIPSTIPACSIYAQILHLENNAFFGSEGLAIHVR